MEAVAIHDFEAKGQEELSFNRDDNLIILNYGDDVKWFDAVKDGKKGIVPENYIKILDSEWYLGKIPRSVAEQMLRDNLVEGAFLVRLSESSPSDFSLSVKSGEHVQHFRVLRDQTGKYYLWDTKFNSINKLVEHYRYESVSRTNEILLKDITSEGQFVVVAKYPFKPEGDDEGVQELDFSKGDIITVFDSADQNWWGGCLRGRRGYFPVTFVQRLTMSSYLELQNIILKVPDSG